MTGIISRSFMSGCHCRSSDLPKHLVSAVIIDVDSVNMPVMGMGDCAERVYQPISRNLMDLFSFILMCFACRLTSNRNRHQIHVCYGH